MKDLKILVLAAIAGAFLVGCTVEEPTPGTSSTTVVHDKPDTPNVTVNPGTTVVTPPAASKTTTTQTTTSPP